MVQMGKATPIRLLVSILTQLKCIVMVAFTRLGVFKSSEEAAYYLGEHSPTTATTTTTNTNDNNRYVLMPGGALPSLVPVPVQILTSYIKNTLPVVHYADFLQNTRSEQDVNVEDENVNGNKAEDEDGKLEMCCSVCWDCIETCHQIRQLCNCSHLFHSDCLDRWVDEGQVTCPLCRSMLLPAKTNPWVVLRNAHLSSQQEQTQITGATT